MKSHLKSLDIAISNAVSDLPAVDLGVLFSGGVDSALLTKYLVDSGRRPILYSCGINGVGDLDFIRDAASLFDLEHRIVEIQEKDLPELACKVMSLIDDKNPVQVGIGIPLFSVFQKAAGDGIKNLVAGQGADELFGGYHRYKEMTEEELAAALQKDVDEIYEKNLRRDMALAEGAGVKVLTPYLDERVIEAARDIPLSLKIKEGVNKYILRKLAEEKGLPESIYSRKKKAVQYSTGVDKVLKKVAKKKGSTLADYLKGL